MRPDLSLRTILWADLILAPLVAWAVFLSLPATSLPFSNYYPVSFYLGPHFWQVALCGLLLLPALWIAISAASEAAVRWQARSLLAWYGVAGCLVVAWSWLTLCDPSWIPLSDHMKPLCPATISLVVLAMPAVIGILAVFSWWAAIRSDGWKRWFFPMVFLSLAWLGASLFFFWL